MTMMRESMKELNSILKSNDEIREGELYRKIINTLLLLLHPYSTHHQACLLTKISKKILQTSKRARERSIKRNEMFTKKMRLLLLPPRSHAHFSIAHTEKLNKFVRAGMRCENIIHTSIQPVKFFDPFLQHNAKKNMCGYYMRSLIERKKKRLTSSARA